MIAPTAGSPSPVPEGRSAASPGDVVQGGPPLAPTPTALPWVPIRSLAPGHRPRILAHLVALSERDRYLRFGYQANDEQIGRYVSGLNFELDEVFGIFNRRLAVVALAHLAFPRPGQALSAGAEFGGSVASHLRGRGYGARLFEHAMLHARNRGVDTLYIHALSENAAMLRIARKAGARVERSGGESDAFLRLPPETLASQVEQWVGEGAAAIDYRVKQGAVGLDALIDAIGEVKLGIDRAQRHNKD